MFLMFRWISYFRSVRQLWLPFSFWNKKCIKKRFKAPFDHVKIQRNPSRCQNCYIVHLTVTPKKCEHLYLLICTGLNCLSKHLPPFLLLFPRMHKELGARRDFSHFLILCPVSMSARHCSLDHQLYTKRGLRQAPDLSTIITVQKQM